MSEPTAYLNGAWVPFSQATLSVADLGIVQAATVTEMIRTFGHQPFRVEQHLARLRGSLTKTGIADPELVSTLPGVIDRIIRENAPLIPTGHDLGIVIVITAGIQPMYAGGSAIASTGATVCVHTFPLLLERWAEHYHTGVHLIVPSVRAMSSEVIDPRIKYRSRLHWFLADREVRSTDPSAMALLADEQGRLTETNSGNLILFNGRSLLTPQEDTVLAGISQDVIFELAAAKGIERQQRDLHVEDVLNAAEAFVSSTSYCLLPVTSINNRPIGTGQVGAMFQELISDWSALVKTDIIGQAQQAARERTP
ncbi:MAG: aminotransferase class IV [Planctomycetaceae bacterium]|nr:aminotransferase class IV [Planctomycetaceae bacterium]